MRAKINLLWIIISLVGGWTMPKGPTTEGQLIDKVIASVDDQPIFYSDLESEYQLHQTQGEKLTKVQILENMVFNKILLAHAAKKNIHIKKEEIEGYLRARMEMIMQQVGTEVRLEQYVGKPIEVFKDELRRSIREQLTLEHMRRLIIEDITVSPQEVKTFYDQLPPHKIPMVPTVVEAYQLVCYPRVVSIGKHILEELRASIVQGGRDFAEVAREKSEDEATAASGGELGFWKIGQLDPAYEKAALSLSPGQVSEVVETRYGFHLIQLIERKKDQYSTRHILMKRRTSKQNSQELIKDVKRIHDDIIKNKISFEEAVKTYSMEGAAVKQRGGLLTDGEGSLQMPIDQLPQELARLLDKLESGTISEPHLFTTSTGEQAARIIYLKKKIPAHKANLEQDYERVYQLALSTKKHKAVEEWLQVAKKKAIIQFDPTYETSKELQQKYKAEVK
jgi:peptidyl-prolyl cis-trans isomerase SurA